MKKLFFICTLNLLLVAIGCEKPVVEPITPVLPPPPPVMNTPPMVSAGADIQLMLPVDSCILTGVVTRTGSKIKTYLWEHVYGPAAYKLENPDSLITKLNGLGEGTYYFKLTVTDSIGLKGTATIFVTVNAMAAFEYDLNLDINASYNHHDDVEICPWDCYFVDETTIASFVPLSRNKDLQINIYEATDSSEQAYNPYYGFTTFRLSDNLYASGTSSYNLKKIIQQGGGPFNGTIQLYSSSALGTPREAAYKALPPLTVTGRLDTTTHTVNMQIKGKIIF